MKIFSYLALLVLIVFNPGCDKQRRFAVTTEAPIEVYACRATFKATGQRGDSKKIAEKGFCYSSEKIPEYGDNNTPATNGFVDLFEAEVTGLLAKTKYYVRAYSRLEDGTVILGNNIEFETTDEYKVGDMGPAKGYIFAANKAASADRYSECILSNTKPLEWGCYGQELKSIGLTGTGLNNSNIIAASCGTNTAAYYCLNYTINGYSDWYLPTIAELSLVHSFASSNPGKIPGGWYLSSSQYSDILCYAIDIGGSSDWLKVAKSIGREVVAVRSFN